MQDFFHCRDNDDLDEDGNAIKKGKDGITDDYESEKTMKEREREELALELQAEEELILEDPGFLNVMWKDLRRKMKAKAKEKKHAEESEDDESESEENYQQRPVPINNRKNSKGSFFSLPKIRFGRGIIGKFYNLKRLLNKVIKIKNVIPS